MYTVFIILFTFLLCNIEFFIFTNNKKILINLNNLYLYPIYYAIIKYIYPIKLYNCLFFKNKYAFIGNALLIAKMVKSVVEGLVGNIFAYIFFNKFIYIKANIYISFFL